VSSVARLPRRAFTKVWGTPRTEPWFNNVNQEQIGEVWFESPPDTPLLIKFLFTSESLSIQVHPDDEYARERHNCLGKTEMWHILRADEGAKIAIGLRRPITREELAAVAGKPEILDLLNWVEVHPGNTFFIPAGTIHALGGGLALCEIQQLSDVTYRLYDYGRDRELHISQSLDVSRLTPGNERRHPVLIESGRELLTECPYFRTEKLVMSGAAHCERHHINIVLEGNVRSGEERFGPGDAFATGDEGCEIESEHAVIVSVTPQCEAVETAK
jgi:mannose-6-phosphate isomerase